MTNTLRQRKSPKKKSTLPTRLALKHWLGNVLTALAAGSVLLSSAAPATEESQAGADPSPPVSASERPRNSAEVRAPEGARIMRDLEYARVGEKKLLLDLYLPEKATGPLPVIVWVHGGGWKNGSKDQCLPARLGFPQRGYAVASVGYRLSGDATFPAQIEDCKAAVRWLRANARKYNLDSDHIGAWGSSAGGHLVNLLGVTGGTRDFDGHGNLKFSSRVQAVCSYYGPSDFAAFVTTPGFERNAQPDSPESRLLGGTVLDNKDKAIRASPVTYISADAPPFLLVHGDRDTAVPLGQSERMHDDLK